MFSYFEFKTLIVVHKAALKNTNNICFVSKIRKVLCKGVCYPDEVAYNCISL